MSAIRFGAVSIERRHFDRQPNWSTVSTDRQGYSVSTDRQGYSVSTDQYLTDRQTKWSTAINSSISGQLIDSQLIDRQTYLKLA
jgi:hypothetical protein